MLLHLKYTIQHPLKWGHLPNRDTSSGPKTCTYIVHCNTLWKENTSLIGTHLHVLNSLKHVQNTLCNWWQLSSKTFPNIVLSCICYSDKQSSWLEIMVVVWLLLSMARHLISSSIQLHDHRGTHCRYSAPRHKCPEFHNFCCVYRKNVELAALRCAWSGLSTGIF